MATRPPYPSHHAATPRRGARKKQGTTATPSATPAATAGRNKRRLLRSSPFLLATLLLFLAAGVTRPVAAAASADGDGDTPVLKPAVGGVPVPPAEDGGEVPVEEDPAKPPEDLYFFLTNKSPRRCFVVTEGKGSMVHVHYHFPGAEDGEKVTLELRSLSDDSTPKNRFAKDVIESKELEQVADSDQFKIKLNVKYSLCAVAATDKKIPGRGLKLYLDLDTGMEDGGYGRIKKEFDLNDVQISMIRLKHEAQQMLREADRAEDDESAYHHLLLQLNHEVLWWPISQVVILVVMGFYQVRHLKSFFQSKRLV